MIRHDSGQHDHLAVIIIVVETVIVNHSVRSMRSLSGSGRVGYSITGNTVGGKSTVNMDNADIAVPARLGRRHGRSIW